MNELKRVIFDRGTVFMLALLTAIGSVLFWLSCTRSMVAKGYAAVYTECYHEILDEFKDADNGPETRERIAKLSNDTQIIGFLTNHLRWFGRDEELDEFIAEYPEYGEALLAGEYQRYMDQPLLAQAQREAYDALKGQLAYLEDFNSYYEAIKRNAERMQHTSIFGDPNSFAYRNTMKTVKDFASIEGAVGELGDDRAVSAVFDDPIADYLMLLFLAVVCIVMLKERRSGLWQLVRATPSGRAKLGAWRIVALLAASLLATVFIFGSRVLISYRLYDGLRYGDRLIQSIPGFNGVTAPMKINTFMLLYCGIKVVCTFGAGLLLYLLLSSVKNTNIAIAITALVLVSEYTLYAAVRDSSILVPFKYVNIFQLIVPKGFTVNYLNLNVFERPLNVRVAVSVVMTALCAAAAAGIILVHVYKRPVGKPSVIEKLVDKIRLKTYRRVGLQETRKVLFAQKCIAVAAALVFVFLSFDSLPMPGVTDMQLGAAGYYRKYAGHVSGETLDRLDEDYARVYELMLNEPESYIRSSYQRTLEGIDYLKMEVEDIIARNASGEYSKEILLLPPFTYMMIFGSSSRDFQTGQGLKALLCICLLTAGMYAYERQSSMQKLLRTLPGGRKKLFFKKQLLTLVFTVLVFAAVYLPEIIAEAKSPFYDGFSWFGYPMQGLEICREWRLPLSVGALTVIFYLIRFIMLYLVGSAVGLVSSLTDRVNTAMVLACAVFVLPACIVAMGVEQLFNYTALPMLWVAGAMFYHEIVPFAVYLALCLGAVVVNYVINCCPRTFGKHN